MGGWLTNTGKDVKFPVGEGLEERLHGKFGAGSSGAVLEETHDSDLLLPLGEELGLARVDGKDDVDDDGKGHGGETLDEKEDLPAPQLRLDLEDPVGDQA